MARLARARDVAPTVRGAFLRAIKMLEDDKRPLSDILYEALLKDPLPVLAVVSKYVPKEMLIEQTEVQSAKTLTDKELREQIDQLVLRASAQLAKSPPPVSETRH